jgi:hypothetical protein
MTNANKLGKVNEPIRVLRKIQARAPDAIIAGGYHRDLYNNVPFNDVDIYIRSDANLSSSEGHDLCNSSYWKSFFNLRLDDWRSADAISELGETDEEYDVANNSNIFTVFAMVKNQIKYNLIIINIDPIVYVDTVFDFGICKTYCDGKKVTFTKEFMSDIENKTITFTEEDVSVASLHHAMQVHLPKLKYKYPTHQLIVPERHQKVYQKYKPHFTS